MPASITENYFRDFASEPSSSAMRKYARTSSFHSKNDENIKDDSKYY
jgi:hypothetical protein